MGMALVLGESDAHSHSSYICLTSLSATEARSDLTSPLSLDTWHYGGPVDDLRGLRAPIHPNLNQELSFDSLVCKRADWVYNA